MKDAMSKLYIKMQNMFSQDEGQDLVEYALILGLVAIGATVALTTMGTSVTAMFTKITAALS